LGDAPVYAQGALLTTAKFIAMSCAYVASAFLMIVLIGLYSMLSL
jgi:hypothetical protein